MALLFSRWLCLIPIALVACNLAVSQPPSASTPQALPRESLARLARVPVGVSFCVPKRNPQTSPIIDRLFNRLTSTEFYPFLLWTGPREYQFAGADAAVELARQSGQPLHGHCLLYALESVSPKFLLNYSGDSQEFEKIVQAYLTAVLTRYRGRVTSYDLFNELFDDHGEVVQKTWLRRPFGSDEEFLDFVGRCYAYAQAADPDALLFYNDYGQEFSRDSFVKGAAIFRQIQNWRRAGVPVHGYGLQFHTNIYRPRGDFEAALKLAARTGLKIHISELDVSINWGDSDVAGVRGGVQGLARSTPELLQRQAQTYRWIASAYRRLIPGPQQHGITVWDVGDLDSWLARFRFEEPTLFDREYRPKPAYFEFLRGLSEPLSAAPR